MNSIEPSMNIRLAALALIRRHGSGTGFLPPDRKHYGKFESWIFEPHVAVDVYKEYIRSAELNFMLQRQASLTL